MMDRHLAQIYQEELALTVETPRLLRQRVASFSPLLGDTTGVVQQAVSEIATAFARHSDSDGTLEFRLFDGEGRFRVELADSLPADYLTGAGREGREEFFRQRILDHLTDRWGVLGDGTAIVWFEVVRTHKTVYQAPDSAAEGSGDAEARDGG